MARLNVSNHEWRTGALAGQRRDSAAEGGGAPPMKTSEDRWLI